jgi:predicted ATPase/DNA-binding SARP family transcriptional activator
MVPDIDSSLLHINLLGPPEVTWAAQPVSITRRQPRAVLYRLAADVRPVPRTQLCYLFWPDVADAIARRNLSRLLVLLRRELPQPAALLADEGVVTLDRGQVQCDTTTYIQLVATHPPARRLALEQAAALVRGPFLDGFALPDCPPFEDWIAEERSIWERRTLDTLALLIEAHTVARDYAAAIGVARRYLQIDAFAEEIHRRLIGLLAAIGERGAAVQQFERCAAILERELGVSPMPETLAAFEAARGSDAVGVKRNGGNAAVLSAASAERVAVAAPATSIPAPATALIGRVAEVAELTALLRRGDLRLLTVSGPGGVGKTRLAIETAQRVAADFADGAVFVALAPLRDAALVVPAIMSALGLPDRSDRLPLAQLCEALRDRELLLLLDNFEHVAAAAGDVAALLAAAPRLHVLVTSRALLRISGEHRFSVPPLSLADPVRLPTLDALAQVESVALFLARARARLPAFQLSAANAHDIATICARLDGLPLAIELAAARAAVLSPKMLLARLDRRLGLLTDGSRDLPERQRTLRATIDWSYRLLDLSEQVLFERLAVFAGGWNLEAAEAVCAAVGSLTIGILDGLQSLIDQHLVQRTGDVAGEPRFAMLETIREYALERLSARGEAPLTQQAHAAYVLALAESAAVAIHGPEQVAWFDRLDEEQANGRVALAWLLESGDLAGALRLAAALHWFWHVRGHFAEGRGWLEQALAAGKADHGAVAPVLVARAQHAASELAIDQGDFVAALDHAQHSIAIWRVLETETAHEQEARRMLPMTLSRLIAAYSLAGDRSGVAAAAPETIARIQALGDPWLHAYQLFHRGHGTLRMQGEIQNAQRDLLEAQRIYRTFGDHWHLAMVAADLALLAVMTGDPETAREQYRETISEARRLRDRSLEADALFGLGEVARLSGDDAEAAHQYEASLRIFRDLDRRLDLLHVIHCTGYLALHAGEIAQARTRFAESLRGFQAAGQPRGQADALAGLAAIAACQPSLPSAALAAGLWGCAAAAHAAERAPIWPADQAEIDRYQALARATLGDAVFEQAYAAGTTLSLEQALAEALRV